MGQVKTIRGVLALHYSINMKDNLATLTKLTHLTHREKQLHQTTCGKYVSNRKKRGLIDIAGQALHVVFGTATDSQIKDVKRQIHVQSVHINQLAVAHEELIKDIYAWKKVLTRRSDRMNEQLYLTRVLEYCNTLNIILEDARNNILNFNYFDVTIIQKEIDKFKTATGLTEISSNLKNSLLLQVIEPNKILITALFTDDSYYDYFNLSPFPMFNTKIPRHKFFTKFRFSDILISNERRKFAVLTVDEINNCLLIEGKRFFRPFLEKIVDFNFCPI